MTNTTLCYCIRWVGQVIDRWVMGAGRYVVFPFHCLEISLVGRWGKNIMTSVYVGINRETNRGKNEPQQNTIQPVFVA